MNLRVSRNLWVLFLCACSYAAFGQAEKELRSRIVAVTVFNDRALVTRQVTANFSAGIVNAKVSGLPILMFDQSVRVAGRGTAEVKIVEVRVEMARLDSIPNVRVKDLQEKISALRNEIRVIDDQAAGLAQQRDFLNRAMIASSEPPKDSRTQGATVESWQKIMSFLSSNHSRMSTEQRGLEAKRKTIEKEISSLQFDLNKIGVSQQTREKNAIVLLDVAKQGSLTLEVSYLIQNASWQPVYDIRAATQEESVELVYNALVWQNTGEDWTDANLVLSTARPASGGTKPTLTAWYVDPYDAKGTVQGFVRDRATGVPIRGTNVTLEGKETVVVNHDGFFVLNNVEPGTYSVRASCLGYQTKTLKVTVSPAQVAPVDFLLQTSAAELSTEGLSISGEAPLVDVKKTAGSQTFQPAPAREADFVVAQVQSAGTTTSFDVRTMATIPSNNEKRKVTIAVTSLKANFRYSCVPKIEPRVYFGATITNTTNFPLLPGSTNAFVDGAYVGISEMPMVIPSGEFSVSLGSDDAIRVTRRMVNKLPESGGLFSKSKKTTYEYAITIENLKKVEARVFLQDNVPVARDERIKVEVLLPNKADVEPTIEGIVTWELVLKPGEKSEPRLKFSVEHPGDMSVKTLE